MTNKLIISSENVHCLLPVDNETILYQSRRLPELADSTRSFHLTQNIPGCVPLTGFLLPPSYPFICPVIHKDGKNSRSYVFTIHSQHLSSHPVQTLDVAADSLEDLTTWVGKIREATQNADARVSVILHKTVTSTYDLIKRIELFSSTLILNT